MIQKSLERLRSLYLLTDKTNPFSLASLLKNTGRRRTAPGDGRRASWWHPYKPLSFVPLPWDYLHFQPNILAQFLPPVHRQLNQLSFVLRHTWHTHAHPDPYHDVLDLVWRLVSLTFAASPLTTVPLRSAEIRARADDIDNHFDELDAGCVSRSTITSFQLL